MATVAYVLHRHNPDGVFLTTYQNRSMKRNIDHLLRKWDLEGREIHWQQELEFDRSKYVAGDGDDPLDPSTSDLDLDQDRTESAMMSATDDDDNDDDEDEDEVVKRVDDDYWLQLAKNEVQKQVASNPQRTSAPTTQAEPQPTKTKPTTTKAIIPLVDYGSSSSSESSESDTEDADYAENPSPEMPKDEGDLESNHPFSSSHKLGDGGALNSVHLLWICKRGRAKSLFKVWSSSKSKSSEKQ